MLKVSGVYTVESTFVMMIIVMTLFGVVSSGLAMYKMIDDYSAACTGELEDEFWACDTMRVERIMESPVKKVIGGYDE